MADSKRKKAMSGSCSSSGSISSSDFARASMADCILPGEILIEILTRLPVKTLLVFKSVCKNWYALISNPSFINTHITQTNLLTKQHLIILNRRPNSRASKHDIKMIFRSKETTHNKSVDLELSCIDSHYRPKIVGSCNGLVCVSVCVNFTEMYLWNPATRVSRDVPPPRLVIPQGKRRYVSVGFGFDPCTNDYKLVRILYSAVEAERKVEVYSKIRDDWRRVSAGSSFRVSENSIAAVVSQGIHWLASGADSSEIIVRFNMGSELFNEISLPDSSRFGNGTGKDLAVVNDLLAVVAYPPGEDLSKCIDVWVMKEYGEEKSWTKHSRVGPFSGIVRPVLCFKSGAIVLQNNKNRLLLYDSNTRKFEKLPLSRAQCIADIHPHIETLVPVRA